jgi:hypothetical protein
VELWNCHWKVCTYTLKPKETYKHSHNPRPHTRHGHTSFFNTHNNFSFNQNILDREVFIIGRLICASGDDLLASVNKSSACYSWHSRCEDEFEFNIYIDIDFSVLGIMHVRQPKDAISAKIHNTSRLVIESQFHELESFTI